MITNYLTSNPAILNEARDYFDGLMLGDGNILCKNNSTGYYQQCCSYKNWLDKISEDLYEYGIKCMVDNGRLRTGGFNRTVIKSFMSYQLFTRSYVEFKEMHDRFYIKWYDIDKYKKYYWHKDESGEYYIWQKVIPKDICLSSICLANEYLGDGGTYKQKGSNSYQTKLSTEGFLREDIIFLADLLSKKFDIKCNVDKVGKIIICTQADIKTFLNYIKDYKVDCYSKKFPEDILNELR